MNNMVLVMITLTSFIMLVASIELLRLSNYRNYMLLLITTFICFMMLSTSLFMLSMHI